MKITFYPRDIGLWRDYFSFGNDITLTPKPATDHKVFESIQELIDFCKGFGVRLDDPEHPFEILDYVHTGRGLMRTVKQWTVIGWMKEEYT